MNDHIGTCDTCEGEFLTYLHEQEGWALTECGTCRFVRERGDK